MMKGVRVVVEIDPSEAQEDETITLERLASYVRGTQEAWGATIYVDCAAGGSLTLDALRRGYGIACEALPKPARKSERGWYW